MDPPRERDVYRARGAYPTLLIFDASEADPYGGGELGEENRRACVPYSVCSSRTDSSRCTRRRTTSLPSSAPRSGRGQGVDALTGPHPLHFDFLLRSFSSPTMAPLSVGFIYQRTRTTAHARSAARLRAYESRAQETSSATTVVTSPHECGNPPAGFSVRG
jgi:hypothetical protein